MVTGRMQVGNEVERVGWSEAVRQRKGECWWEMLTDAASSLLSKMTLVCSVNPSYAAPRCLISLLSSFSWGGGNTLYVFCVQERVCFLISTSREDSSHVHTAYIYMCSEDPLQRLYSWQTHHCLTDSCVTMETQHQVRNSCSQTVSMHTQHQSDTWMISHHWQLGCKHKLQRCDHIVWKMTSYARISTSNG